MTTLPSEGRFNCQPLPFIRPSKARSNKAREHEGPMSSERKDLNTLRFQDHPHNLPDFQNLNPDQPPVSPPEQQRSPPAADAHRTPP